MSTFPLPITLPLAGLNTVNTNVPLESGYAREFTNLCLYNGKVRIRPAFRTAAYNGTFAGLSVHWYDITSAPDFWCILANGDIRKLSDGSGASSIGGAPSYNATQCKHKSLDLVIGCRAPRLAAAPFTAWGFTTSTIVDTTIRCACSHKGRLYVFDSSNMEYSDPGVVSGTMNPVYPLAEYLDGQSILRAFSVSTVVGDGSQNVLVIVADGGRILVYQGDYPTHATWDQIGKYDVDPPISNVGFVEKDDDVWVSTRAYPFWLKELFNKPAGQPAYTNSPGLPIEDLWQGLGWSSLVAQPEVSHSFYEPRLDAIVTQCSEKDTGPNPLSQIAEYQNEGIYLAYFRRYNAWAVWFATPMFTPVIQTAKTNTAVVYGTSYDPEIKQVVHGNVVDHYTNETEIDIEGSWKTPHIAPALGYKWKANGVRVFFRNDDVDLGFLDTIRAIFNYSDEEAPLGWQTQSMVSQITPTEAVSESVRSQPVASEHYSPRVDVGGIGDLGSFQFILKRRGGSDAEQIQSINRVVAYLGQGGDAG